MVSLLGLLFCGPVYIQAKGEDKHKCKEETVQVVQSSKNAVPANIPLVKIK